MYIYNSSSTAIDFSYNNIPFGRIRIAISTLELSNKPFSPKITTNKGKNKYKLTLQWVLCETHVPI